MRTYDGDCMVEYDESITLGTGELYSQTLEVGSCDEYGTRTSIDVTLTSSETAYGDTVQEYVINRTPTYDDELLTELTSEYVLDSGDEVFRYTTTYEYDADEYLTSWTRIWDASWGIGYDASAHLDTSYSQDVHPSSLLNMTEYDEGMDGVIEEALTWDREESGEVVFYTQNIVDGLTYAQTYENDSTEWTRAVEIVRDIDIDATDDYRFNFTYGADTWPYDYEVLISDAADDTLFGTENWSTSCE